MAYTALLILLFFIAFLTGFYKIKIFIPLLLLINVFSDMISGFVPEGAYFGLVKHLANFIIVLFFLIKKVSLSKKDRPIYLFVSYFLIMAFLSTDMISSINFIMPFLTSLLLFPLAIQILKTNPILYSVKQLFNVLLFLYPLYILLANIIGFGESYGIIFSAGFLTTSGIYPIVINILAGFHILKSRLKIRKFNIVYFLVISLNISILLLNMRRTAILVLAVGIVSFLVLERKFKLIFISLFIIVISAVFINFLFSDIMTSQIEAREHIFDSETYDQEGRYLEFLYIIDYAQRNFNLGNYLFGRDLMITESFGLKYFGRSRTIHSDWINIFYGAGLLGVFLMLNVFYSFYKNLNDYTNNSEAYYRHAGMVVLIVFGTFMVFGRLIGFYTTTASIIILFSIILNESKYRAHNLMKK